MDDTPSLLTGVSFISLTEIQNARSIMNVLTEMLSALDPANKEVCVHNLKSREKEDKFVYLLK